MQVSNVFFIVYYEDVFRSYYEWKVCSDRI